jgi:hypothetical protein
MYSTLNWARASSFHMLSNPLYIIILSGKVVQTVMLVICIWEVPGSDLSRNIYEGESVNRAQMDINVKRTIFEPVKKHLFLDIS